MTKEINIFDNKEIVSFNNSDLSTNLKSAETAIAALKDDFRIHNHSNTQFAWHRFILVHKGGLRNARQITAEINKKNLALSEAKHNHKRKIIELEMLRENLNSNKRLNKFDVSFIRLDIENTEDQLKLSLAPIEGAIKDILTLKNSYDQIMKEYKNYSEQDLENEEVEYWIRRLFSQALADIRECGAIRAGNQMSIEQMNLNVSMVEDDLNRYLENKERASKDPSGAALYEFLELCVKKYSEAVKSFIGYGDFNGEIVEDSIYHPALED